VQWEVGKKLKLLWEKMEVLGVVRKSRSMGRTSHCPGDRIVGT